MDREHSHDFLNSNLRGITYSGEPLDYHEQNSAVYDISEDSDLHGVPVIQPYTTSAMIATYCNSTMDALETPSKLGKRSSQFKKDHPILVFFVPGGLGCRKSAAVVHRIMQRIVGPGNYDCDRDKLAVWTPKKLTGSGDVQGVKICFSSGSAENPKEYCFVRRDAAVAALHSWASDHNVTPPQHPLSLPLVPSGTPNDSNDQTGEQTTTETPQTSHINPTPTDERQTILPAPPLAGMICMYNDILNMVYYTHVPTAPTPTSPAFVTLFIGHLPPTMTHAGLVYLLSYFLQANVSPSCVFIMHTQTHNNTINGFVILPHAFAALLLSYHGRALLREDHVFIGFDSSSVESYSQLQYGTVRFPALVVQINHLPLLPLAYSSPALALLT